MRKARFVYVFLIAFIKRFKVLLSLGVVIGIVIFLATTFLIPRLFPKSVEYIGHVGRYHTDELPQSVLSGIGEGLTRMDETGMPQPALAKSWEVADSGKTWTFKLDPARVWHDGTAVTSATVQYSFEDVTVERPDTQTIVFKLQNPYAPFPIVVSNPTFKRGLIGTAEWKVVNLSVSSTFVEKLELTNTKTGTRKILRFYPSEDAAKTAFKLGQVDRLEDLYVSSPFDAWNTSNVVEQVDAQSYVGIFFNNRNEPFANNKTLRQALAYAIDKQMWSGKRAISPVPENSWSFNAQVKTYEYDLAHAKELLKTSLGKTPDLTLKLITSRDLLPVAEKIAHDWNELGVHTDVQVASSVPEDYQVYLGLYKVSLDPDQYLTWHSTQDTTNITHYSDRRIDKLLEDGRLEVDQEKRKKIYLDFQRFLLEDVPAVFLYHPTLYTVLRK